MIAFRSQSRQPSPDIGDNHFYIIASDNNDYRSRLPAACPPLARRLPAACPPLARRLPAASKYAWLDIINLILGGHPNII